MYAQRYKSCKFTQQSAPGWGIRPLRGKANWHQIVSHRSTVHRCLLQPERLHILLKQIIAASALISMPLLLRHHPLHLLKQLLPSLPLVRCRLSLYGGIGESEVEAACEDEVVELEGDGCGGTDTARADWSLTTLLVPPDDDHGEVNTVVVVVLLALVHLLLVVPPPPPPPPLRLCCLSLLESAPASLRQRHIVVVILRHLAPLSFHFFLFVVHTVRVLGRQQRQQHNSSSNSKRRRAMNRGSIRVHGCGQ